MTWSDPGFVFLGVCLAGLGIAEQTIQSIEDMIFVLLGK
jgi:hypothetical protein